MHVHLQSQSTLLLSDSQDVGGTFITLRLWFLFCCSCLFSALPLNWAELLNYFSLWWSLSLYPEWGRREWRGGKMCLLLGFLFHPPYSSTTHPSINPSHLHPSLPLSRTSWFSPHHPRFFSFLDFLPLHVLGNFLLSGRREVVWVTDSWASTHKLTSACRCWGLLSSLTWLHCILTWM